MRVDAHRTTGRFRDGSRVLFYGRCASTWLHIEVGRYAVHFRCRRKLSPQEGG